VGVRKVSTGRGGWAGLKRRGKGDELKAVALDDGANCEEEGSPHFQPFSAIIFAAPAVSSTASLTTP
jgi:hypothetical protein